MKPVKVMLRSGESLTTELPDHVTPEGWLHAAKHDLKTIAINGTTYLTKEIVSVTELKRRTAFTNTEGI